MQFDCPCSFNPYDSDTFDNIGYCEEEAIPENIEDLNAHPSEPMIFDNALQLRTPPEEQQQPQEPKIPSILKFPDLEASRQFFEEEIGIQPRELSRLDQDGLVILPLQFYCLIRNVTKSLGKPVPHLIVVPNEIDFERDHYDFATAISELYE